MAYPHAEQVISRRVRSGPDTGRMLDWRLQSAPRSAALDDIGPLSGGSVLLGISGERLPVLFNLHDPSPGAFLIFGDPQSGKTDLLLSIFQSAGLLNPGRVSLALIASEHYAAARFGVSAEHLEIWRPYQPEASSMIEKWVRLAQRRLEGQSCEPAILLGIDELDLFFTSLPQRARRAFFWLVRNGAAARIWTFATLSSRAESQNVLENDLRGEFPSLLLGRLEDKALAARLTGGEFLPCALLPGMEFCLSAGRNGLSRPSLRWGNGVSASYGRKWMRFSIFRHNLSECRFVKEND